PGQENKVRLGWRGARGGRSPLSDARHRFPSCAGLTRASIEKGTLSKRMDCRVISAFTRVHSPSKTGVNALNDALCPAMTNAGAPYPYLTMSNSPTQRSAARCGASGPRVGVERGREPRRRGQLDELRLDIRLRGRHVGAYPCAVVANEKLDRVPERAVRPSEDESVAIAQRGEIGGLDRRALRFPFPHRLDDLMQPRPTLRRDARAALIDLAAAASPAPAGFVAARAP